MESKEKFIPPYREILKAQKKITPYIYQTPIFQNEWINKLTNFIIFFKCENLQKTGSFKLRGATNALLNYIEQAKKMVLLHILLEILRKPYHIFPQS